jgi:hypothetical protein
MNIGHTFNSHGFLRGYCHLCRENDSVQIAGSAADDAYDEVGRKMVEHMRDAHGIEARQFCGQIERVEQKKTETPCAA